MRLLKRRLSLHTRLLLVGFVAGLAALIVAAGAIGHVLEDFVRQGVDQKISTQIKALAAAVGPDGRLDETRLLLLPDFAEPHTAWAYRVRGPAGTWQGGRGIVERPPPPFRTHRARIPGEKHALLIGRTQRFGRLYVQQAWVETEAGRVQIVAGAPRYIVDAPLDEAMAALLWSLGLLTLGLAVSTFIQLRYGLGPVRAIRTEIARVRAGERDRLSTDQPRELRPLAEEVNALVAQNEAGLAHARRHVSNLAHGLKTPLATLTLKLRRDGAPAETIALAESLDQRIAHHLRRARSAAAGAGERARTAVASVVEDLLPVMERIHAERGVAIETDVADDLIAAAERQDLDEMIGNLLDNGCRHAVSKVCVSAEPEEKSVIVRVEDDGPGLGEDDMKRALMAGERLDEAGTGYGFGLAIVEELAELYGGGLELGRSADLGGLSVILRIPRPAKTEG